MTEKFQSLAQAREDGVELDFRYEDEPRCPHCGESIDISKRDLNELYEEGEHIIDCPLCELEFSVATTVKHSFSTDHNIKPE